jgi:hypothetical protein
MLPSAPHLCFGRSWATRGDGNDVKVTGTSRSRRPLRAGDPIGGGAEDPAGRGGVGDPHA